MKLKYLLLLFLTAGLVTACEESDDAGDDTSMLSLNISGLEDLGSGYAYEGWIIVDGMPVTTGTFTADANGGLSQSEFEIDAMDAAAATMFVLSIEPVPDSDPAPAATKLMNGEISNGTATLATGILGDFSAAAGQFFLRTPTDETDGNNGNDQFGVWFGEPAMPPTSGFTLPTLPEGWAYEGWVVGESGPLTTGVFTEFEMADDAAPYSGTQAGPPIPGEDFLMNAPTGETFPLDLRGRTMVISIEPVPDNSTAPFLLKPLLGTAGQDTAPTVYEMNQNFGSFPTGSVMIE